ncbi:acyl-CoA-sterol acyltransferase Are1 [Schizosaccharomyces pombe]|uniref:Probable sterol O-acyltransferase 1 n=1 Tax=Schizosaccharomyces pombe (strain 972 / ATCC 24843) TaxID=284812 RepID=AREH1_SCHPO|nr:putative acyl-coA-sterol acyltransferase Are1 [Schizosaccharomyces pombe]Q10269.1 RecName: Full=Probable sterol O-acyltransferase 1; AltName: Full=Sterol-ester synthase 1 [Schizosaccharomyces pombe 972h-]CAA93593.1 acyl-coA-sterol acyltransferase Are1 (predicted) [Schizosaccharomyces pombe]|eukprot:NP_593707.1 putative acyl-coA-sterol acyltransferase Are1 [Schizosaccharomyces pombe]
MTDTPRILITPSPLSDISTTINKPNVHPSMSLLKALPECRLVVKSKGDKNNANVVEFPLDRHKQLLIAGKVYHDYKFKPRKSIFDRVTDPNYFAKSEFRGFYVLFWLSMAAWVLQLYARSYWQRDTLLGLPLARQVFRQFFVLFSSDFLMICLSFFSYGLQVCIEKNMIRWANLGYTIQTLWQGFYMVLAVYWVKHRDFPIVQCVFFTLHCAVLIMKQFSYSHHMGYISEIRILHNEYEKLLKFVRECLNSTEKDEKYTFELTFPNKPAETISTLQAEEIVALTAKYLSRQMRSEVGNVVYPDNINFFNYVDYLLVPSLVYSMEFPRVAHFRWHYMAFKAGSTFGLLALTLALVDWYFVPSAVAVKDLDFIGKLRIAPLLMNKIMFPAIILYLIMFYLIFDCILNAFAEITKFADRGFYGAWWNTVTWDEFSREWNKPVHVFLMRHVYHSSISGFKLKKSHAVLLTFLISALVHEFVMLLATGKFRCYILTFQLLQIPLYDLQQMFAFKKRDILGNVFFWIGMFTGPSFLCILYIVF